MKTKEFTECELTNSHSVLPMNSGAEAVETAIRCFGPFTPGFKSIPYGDAKALKDIISTNNTLIIH